MSGVDASNAHLHQSGFIGGFYIRSMSLPAGESNEGHEHFTDHVSNILETPVRIEWTNPRTGETGVVHIEAPCKVLIKADIWHRFVALEKPVRWECWFPEDHEPGALVRWWRRLFPRRSRGVLVMERAHG